MGGMFLRSKRASERQSLASSRSPWTTWMATLVWPSTPVVKCSVALAGMVELRWMILATDAAVGFDAERERRDVEQQQVVRARSRRSAGEDAGLDGGAEGDDLVGVELGVQSFAAGFEIEEAGDECAHGGDAGGAADHDDFVDLRGGELRRRAGPG